MNAKEKQYILAQLEPADVWLFFLKNTWNN